MITRKKTPKRILLLLCLSLLCSQGSLTAFAADQGQTRTGQAASAEKNTDPAESSATSDESNKAEDEDTAPASDRETADEPDTSKGGSSESDAGQQKDSSAEDPDTDDAAPANSGTDTDPSSDESADTDKSADSGKSAGTDNSAETSNSADTFNSADSKDSAADRNSAGSAAADSDPASADPDSSGAASGSEKKTETDSAAKSPEDPTSGKSDAADPAAAAPSGTNTGDATAADPAAPAGASPASEAAPVKAMLKSVRKSDFQDADVIHVGDSISVEVKISDPCRLFRFTPEESGMYYFYTEGTTGDAYGELYDKNATLLAESDDIVDGVNRNFGIDYPCQAGKDYYLRARQYNYGPDSFTVHVSKKESTRPQVYRVGDRNRTFGPGEEATVTVSAHSDNPFTYVWTWDTYARSVEDGIEGAHSESFTFPVTRTGVLHCTVIDDENPDLWDNCTFLISIDNKLEAWPEGNDKTNPDRTVIARAGEDITLKTLVSAIDTEDLSYQWYLWEGGEAPEDSTFPQSNKEIEGATSATYTVPAGSPSDDYGCVVTDPYGASKTVTFHTKVNHLRVYPEGGKKSETSRTLTLTPGDTAHMAVTVDADDKSGLTYSWYRGYPSEETKIAGASKSSFDLADVRESQGIVCVVKDPYGNEGFCYFYLRFQELRVWPKGGEPGDWSIDLAVKAGDKASLAVETDPDAEGPLTYKWFDDDYNEVSGADKASFTTPAVSRNTTYTCEVSDSYGNTESVTFRIQTNHMQAWPDNEEPGAESTDISVLPNETATIGVAVKADDTDGLTYTWYDADFNEISGLTGASWTTSAIIGPRSYICRVADTYGNEAYLTFNLSSNHLTAEAVGERESEDVHTAILYAEAGDTVVLQTKASSDNPSEIGYRWYDYYDNYYRYDKTNYSSSYKVENCTKNSSWRCLVYDPYGNRVELFFQIRIQNHLKAYPAGTDESTEEITVYADEDGKARLEVVAEAVNTDGIRYLWFYGPEAEDLPGITIEEDSPVLEDTITEKTVYTCLVRDAYGNEKTIHFTVLPAEKEPPEDHEHEWGDVVIEWPDNAASAKASRTCSLCGEIESETVATTAKITAEPGCETWGETTFTASFKNKAFGTRTKTVKNRRPLGHDWGPWTEMVSAMALAPSQEVTEVRTCSRCGKEEFRTVKRDMEDIPEEEGDDSGKGVSPKKNSGSPKGSSSGKKSGKQSGSSSEKISGKQSGSSSGKISGKQSGSSSGTAKKASSGTGKKGAAPRTADENSPILWISLSLLSAALASLLKKYHKQ